MKKKITLDRLKCIKKTEMGRDEPYLALFPVCKLDGKAEALKGYLTKVYTKVQAGQAIDDPALVRGPDGELPGANSFEVDFGDAEDPFLVVMLYEADARQDVHKRLAEDPDIRNTVQEGLGLADIIKIIKSPPTDVLGWIGVVVTLVKKGSMDDFICSREIKLDEPVEGPVVLEGTGPGKYELTLKVE